MSRTDQINELLKSELANLINKQDLLHDGLITISYVDCSPDLNRAEVGISVLPDNLAGTALRKLKSNTVSFANILKKKLKIKKIPNIKWVFDPTEKEAGIMDEVFKTINKEN